MLKPISTLLLLLVIPLQLTFSQKAKFGKVSKQELDEKYYPLDSTANAAILFKKRRTYYDYSGQEGWTLITKVHERIKIYNKEGYDWATKKISLYSRSGKDEKVSIKASTFNLVNNKIEKTKLKSSEVFTENVNKYWDQKKLTMPNLTEGCVVEWEYSIRSPFYSNINDMVFQYEIPVKFIDSEIKIPEYFVFKYLPSAYYPVKINQTKTNRKLNFTYRTDQDGNAFTGARTTSQNASVDISEKIYSSIEKNIPAIRDEPYTNNIDNYKSKTSFEITAYIPPTGTHKYYNNNWEDVTKTIYKSQNFGDQLGKTKHFEQDLQNLVASTAPLNEKIGTILQFVKGKIKWDGFNSKYTIKGVKKAYNEGVGNVAEINLTLVAMLQKAGVKANPVLISTRSNGISLFPTTEGLNYVIAGIETGTGVILLDATEEYSLPNVLPLRDLNWQGRIVRQDETSESVNLFPKAHASEKAFLNVKIDNDAFVTGLSRTTYNNLLALNYRKENNSLSEEALIGKVEKNNEDIEITDFRLTNKMEISKSLVQTYKFETDNQVEIIGDKMYFSPLLFLGEKENPFKLEDRKFPVDFGAPWEEKYTITIQLPEGYTVESKPENVAYAMPDNFGSYKFVLIDKDNKIQILSTAKINVPVLGPDNYIALKQFYKKMIEKQLEKVVLVKQ